jgi:hypothetical protein
MENLVREDQEWCGAACTARRRVDRGVAGVQVGRFRMLLRARQFIRYLSEHYQRKKSLIHDLGAKIDDASAADVGKQRRSFSGRSPIVFSQGHAQDRRIRAGAPGGRPGLRRAWTDSSRLNPLWPWPSKAA